jgi:hypothetical protein
MPDVQLPATFWINRADHLPIFDTFASTMERLCLLWNLTANIGIKFSVARKGILVLTGLLVDPGFGLREVGECWVAKDDERLHFLLANVGPNQVVLIPGEEKIASIQFFSVSGEVQKREVLSTTDMQNEFFDSSEEPKLGLSFFRDMADMKSQFHDIGTRVDVVEKGSNQVVMFGTYLLGVTFLVALLTTQFGLVSLENVRPKIDQFSQGLPHTWPGSLSLMGICATILLLPYSLAKIWTAITELNRKSGRDFWRR